MRLLFKNQKLDLYPTADGKEFYMRTTYNEGSKGVWGEDSIYEFYTSGIIDKGTALTVINAYVADGAEIVDFNYEEYDVADDEDDDNDDD